VAEPGDDDDEEEEFQPTRRPFRRPSPPCNLHSPGLSVLLFTSAKAVEKRKSRLPYCTAEGKGQKRGRMARQKDGDKNNEKEHGKIRK